MPTYDAFQIVDDNDMSHTILWWDGKTIRSDDPGFLSQLKREQIGRHTFGDGKSFFDLIPQRYRNGYTNTKKIKVDEEGKQIS